MSARSRMLGPEARRLRHHVIAALWDDSRFGYVDSDRFIGGCPVCGGAIGVRFAGYAARVTLICYGGRCSEAAVAGAIGLVVTP